MKYLILVLAAIFIHPVFAGAQDSPTNVPVPVEGQATGSAPDAGGHGLRGLKDMMKGGGSASADRGNMSILSQLNLTPEQQKKVDEIMAKNRSNQQANRKEMATQMKQLRDLMSASDFNEAEFRKAHQKLSTLQEDMMVNRAKMKGEIKIVLTPEQQAKWQQLQEEMRQRAFGPQGMMGGTEN